MAVLTISVSKRRARYVAVGERPNVTAFGATALAAAENARIATSALMETAPLATMVLFRLNDLNRCTIIMQPLANPIVETAAAD